MKTAAFQGRIGDEVQCLLCPHGCLLAEGQRGRCHVRSNLHGTLIADGYGHISAAHVDPVEKKPLYHFFPGSQVFSIGGSGCNFHCRFCQNWSISQQFLEQKAVVTPAEIVQQALDSGSIGVAYTYNEPLVGWEFVYDCALAVRKAGLKNVLVTNGFVNKVPADKLLAEMDAVNLDIKSMEDHFYREYCGGTLPPVLRFAIQAVASDVHLELTHLLIPGLNSDMRQVDRLASWIASELHDAVPLHITGYRPAYCLSVASTGEDLLRCAYEQACRRLAYVYTGNIDIPEGRNTFCRDCGKVLVRRSGNYTVLNDMTEEGLCASCGAVSGILVHQSSSV